MSSKRSTTTEGYQNVLIDCGAFMSDHLHDPITLDDFCTQCHYSRRSTQRALTWHRTTWRRLLRDARMRRACHLLANTNCVVSDVAKMVGYKQASQFAKAFRAYAGMNPRTYRSEASRGGL